MPKRKARDLSVGALATLALLVLAFTVMSVGGQSRLFSSKAHYRTVFPNTEGLRVGSPVKIAGVQVGTVTAIHLPTRPDAPGIEAELGVEAVYEGRVRGNSRTALRYLQWLSGEKYVEVTPGDPAAPELPPGSVIPVLQETQFLQQGADIAENLNEITAALKDILAALQEGKGLLGELIHDPEFGKESLGHLKTTLENLEEITDRIRRGQGLAGRLVHDPSVGQSVDDLTRSLRDLSRFLDALARGEGALGALAAEGGTGEQAIVEARDAAASLRRTAERLESKEGLLGRLLNDTEYSERVARDLETTLGNLAEITGKINSGKGTLGALVNERVLHDSMEDVVAGVGDSDFARWLLRHYQKKGIEAEAK